MFSICLILDFFKKLGPSSLSKIEVHMNSIQENICTLVWNCHEILRVFTSKWLHAKMMCLAAKKTVLCPFSDLNLNPF